MRRAEMRQRPGDGLEIVQQAQLREPEALGEFHAPEPPIRAIGQHDFLAVDRPGNRQRGRARACAGLLEIARNRGVEVGGGIVMDHQDVLDRAGGVRDRKPALAAADVGEESGAHDRYPGLITLS